MLGAYARGGAAWVLGFAMLMPWLLSLDRMRTLRASFASGIVLSVLFVVAVFVWFGDAVASYTGIGSVGGVLLLALAAPLLQPQVTAYALVRQLAGRRFGPVLRALAESPTIEHLLQIWNNPAAQAIWTDEHTAVATARKESL